MKIKKYRPAFFVGFPDEEYEVNSKQELLDSELCINARSMKSFDKFSFRADEEQGVLSVHFENGEHYVVALVHNKEDIATLDEWFNPKPRPMTKEELRKAKQEIQETFDDFAKWYYETEAKIIKKKKHNTYKIMTYKDFKEKTAHALYSMCIVTQEPLAGHLYGCSFIKRPMIYLGKKEEDAPLAYKFFYHLNQHDATNSLAKDEFYPITLVPQNDFGEYALLMCLTFINEHPDVLTWLLDQKALDPNYRETDDELALRCMLDTINLSKVLKGKDTEQAIHQVERAVYMSCRKRALNNYQYSRICCGKLRDDISLEHKQRVHAFMEEFISDFRTMQTEFQTRFDRTQDWMY